jgi:hypothetical protein
MGEYAAYKNPEPESKDGLPPDSEPQVSLSSLPSSPGPELQEAVALPRGGLFSLTGALRPWEGRLLPPKAKETLWRRMAPRATSCSAKDC